MMHALGWAGAMAAILVMCLWLGTRKARLRRTEQAWLPVELQHARIEFAERYFYTKRPVRLIAKVDRVYKDERAHPLCHRAEAKSQDAGVSVRRG